MTYNADSVFWAQFTSCYVIHYNEKCENSISTRSSLDHSRHSLHFQVMHRGTTIILANCIVTLIYIYVLYKREKEVQRVSKVTQAILEHRDNKEKM